jgi:predicted secreted hydrolase
MRRRAFLLALAALPAGALAEPAFAPVRRGRPLVFPADFGAHPEFRTEWWYATGWLQQPDGRPLGFQVTFFRVRTGIGEDNASAFAPRQIMMAHAALADPAHSRLRHAERAARAGFGHATYATDQTNVRIGDWRLAQEGPAYRAEVGGDEFAYDLTLRPAGPPMLNGEAGFSAKDRDPKHASHYYSRPQLAVAGTVRIGHKEQSVSGRAWLDHEWSSELLASGSTGWDWIGINLADGGALMAFRLRDANGTANWAAATLRHPDGRQETLPASAISFTPLRHWRSPRTALSYPVDWRLTIGQRSFLLIPLMDDQELDSRRSTGAIYWEGAVRLSADGREVGRGYLEMTGYGERLRLG